MYRTKAFISAVLALIFTGLLTGQAAAQQAGIEPPEFQRNGLAGWQFLQILTGPRHAGLGGAYTALDDASGAAIFGNPAAVAGIDNFDVYLSRVNWIADIGHQSGAIVKDFGNWGTIGASIQFVDIGDMDETINREIPGEDRTEVVITGETFTANDLAAGLTYARNVTDRLSVGGNVRFIREKIAEVSMSNVSIDLGTVYYTGFRSLRIAMSARNLGPDQNLTGWSENFQSEAADVRMPIDYRLGVAFDFFEEATENHTLTVITEGIHLNDAPERVNAGLEYSFMNLVYLRGGYRFNYDEESFTLGGGIHYDSDGIGVKVDYGYVDFGILTQVHMFSVGLSF